MFPITRRITKKGRTYEYVQIIENYRKNGKIRQRIVFTLGSKERVNPTFIDALIENLEKFSETLMVLKKDNPDCSIAWAKDYGLPFLYQRLWERIGMDEIVRDLVRNRGFQFDVERSLFLLVLNRLMNPMSELGISAWKDAIYLDGNPFAGLDLHHLYRTLDVLEHEKETVETRLFEKTRSLFNSSVTLVFFDTTSTYFEGSGKCSHELLAYGHSKDHRSDRKQIVVGVLMDQNSIPIGCEVRPGNTQDATAVKELIATVKERFTIKDLVWVSDGGTSGEEAIGLMREEKIHFILGARMRNVKEVYEKIEDTKGRETIMAAMKPIPNHDELTYYEFSSEHHSGRRYVIVHNSREAEREKRTREKVTKKLETVLERNQGVKDLIKNKSYKKYLKVEGKTSMRLDQEKIADDESYDGLFVLQTDTDLPAQTAVMRYKDLYRVEHAFRCLKSRLDVRPVFHRKDERITAHVFVNFLALYLQCALERLLTGKGWIIPDIHVGLADIAKMRMACVTLKDNAYEVRTELEGTAHTLLNALGISPGKRMRKLEKKDKDKV